MEHEASDGSSRQRGARRVDVNVRRRGAWAPRCLLLFSAVLAGALWAGAARAQAITLAETASEPGVIIYPARAPGARQLTVALHGMCGHPANLCRHFAAHVTADSHLICPQASRRCPGGGASWPASGFAEQIERAVGRAEAELGARVDEARGRTLIGYSLGAFRALEIAHRAGGTYPRLMLIGAKIYPNPRLLRQSGVERLLLSAGARDLMHDHMRNETQRLARAGFRARFLGLGPVGHFFTPSFADYLPEALRWLHGEDGSA